MDLKNKNSRRINQLERSIELDRNNSKEGSIDRSQGSRKSNFEESLFLRSKEFPKFVSTEQGNSLSKFTPNVSLHHYYFSLTFKEISQQACHLQYKPKNPTGKENIKELFEALKAMDKIEGGEAAVISMLKSKMCLVCSNCQDKNFQKNGHE
jgi:hypothetical protein